MLRAAITRIRPLRTAHPVRGLAGPVKVFALDQESLDGPIAVRRSEPLLEMGGRYEPGEPSPMEGTMSFDPIVVDGLVAKTGGGSLGNPVQYIQLSAWDPTPQACKYTGLRFVSKQV